MNKEFTEFLKFDINLAKFKESVRVMSFVHVLPNEYVSFEDCSIVHVKALRQNIRTKKNVKAINCQLLDDVHLAIADTAKLLHIIDIADEDNKQDTGQTKVSAVGNGNLSERETAVYVTSK